MSGVEYRKLPHGPVADLYFRALDELEESGDIKRQNKCSTILLSLATPTVAFGNLDADELKMIQDVSECWISKSTKQIVDFTHQQITWQIARDGEVIPYGLITQEEQSRIYG